MTFNETYQLIKNLPEAEQRVLQNAVRQQSLERAIRTARYNPNAFMEFVMRKEGGKRIKQAPFHRRWQYKMHAPPPVRLAIIAFRASAKTEQLIGAILKMIGDCGSSPDIRIKYVSSNEKHARRSVERIGKTIKENRRYHQVYPHIKPSLPWSSTQLGLAGRTARDANVEAWTVMGQGVGGRSDILALDDVVSSQNAIERPNMQEKLIHTITQTWFPTVAMHKSITYGNKIIILGTPWSATDFNMTIYNHPEWHDNAEFLPVYDDDGKPAWPAEIDNKQIRQIKAMMDLDSPFHFRCQMLLDPLDPSMALFGAAAINSAQAKGAELGLVYGSKEYLDYMMEGTIVVGVDFAIAETSRAAYSVVWVGSVDARGVLWPVEITRGRMKPQETIYHIIRVNEKYNPAAICVEINGFQRMIHDQLGEQAVALPLMAETTSTNKANLEIGIPPMAAAMENGRIGYPLLNPPNHPAECECHLCVQHRPGANTDIQVWLDELTKFGAGGYTDTVMASWLAWRAAGRVCQAYSDIEWRPYNSLEADNLIDAFACDISGCSGSYMPSLREDKTAWVCMKCGHTREMPGRGLFEDMGSPQEHDSFELMMRAYLAA